MTLRVVVADDESLVRKSIRRFLRDHDVEIIEECGDGVSALQAIRSKAPNLVFLDIQMPEMTGMDIINALGEKTTASNYNHHCACQFRGECVRIQRC